MGFELEACFSAYLPLCKILLLACAFIFPVCIFHHLGYYTRSEFLREILYKNIAVIAIQHSKMYFVDTFGDFYHTVE